MYSPSSVIFQVFGRVVVVQFSVGRCVFFFSFLATFTFQPKELRTHTTKKKKTMANVKEKKEREKEKLKAPRGHCNLASNRINLRKKRETFTTGRFGGCDRSEIGKREKKINKYKKEMITCGGDGCNISFSLFGS